MELELNNKLNKVATKMKMLINLNKFEKSIKSNIIIQDSNYAQYINENLHKMEYNDKLSLYKKLFTDMKIDNELLNYELIHLVPTKVNTVEEFIRDTKKYLNRYHKKIVGSLFEDDVWSLHKYNKDKPDVVQKYELLENEFIFDNSISRYEHDNTTNLFVKNIINLLGKINDKIKVTYKYIDEPGDNMIWVLILCTNSSLCEE